MTVRLSLSLPSSVHRLMRVALVVIWFHETPAVGWPFQSAAMSALSVKLENMSDSNLPNRCSNDGPDPPEGSRFGNRR